jgi:hypothetical protein
MLKTLSMLRLLKGPVYMSEGPGVHVEAQVGRELVQPGNDLSNSTLRDRVSGELRGNGYGRNHIRDDQHAILRNLRPRHPFHAAENGVEGDDYHTDDDPDRNRFDAEPIRQWREEITEESAEDDADALHLSGDVRERNKERCDSRHHASRFRVIPARDEVRNRVLAELSEVGSKQERQKDISTRPSHEIDRAIEAAK